MSRLTADDVRKITLEQRAEKRKLSILSRENRIRREKIWLKLYGSAIDGENGHEFADLPDDDIEFFSNLGFAVEQVGDSHGSEKYDLTYTQRLRLMESSYNINCEKKLKLENELRELEALLNKFYESKFLFDESKLLKWIIKNAAVAYQADLEGWFDIDNGGLNWDAEDWKLEDLERFLGIVKAKRNISKDPDKILALGGLVDALYWSIKTYRGPIDDVTIQSRVDELTDEISSIDAEQDIIQDNIDEMDLIIEAHGEKVRFLHKFSWGNISSEYSGSVDDFNIKSLAWLASEHGQKALASIENRITEAAKNRKDSIKIKLHRSDRGITICDQSGFEICYFISFYDFKTTISILGYKFYELKENDSIHTINVGW